jgi:hypothetical protein
MRREDPLRWARPPLSSGRDGLGAELSLPKLLEK